MILGRDFLEVVKLLMDTETEASQRTQIGRSYYAAFLESRQCCEKNLQLVRSRTPREHMNVAQALAVIDPQLKVDLAFLRSIRNGADYDIDLAPETITLQADQARRLARSIVSRLDSWTAAERVTSSDSQRLVDPGIDPDQ